MNDDLELLQSITMGLNKEVDLQKSSIDLVNDFIYNHNDLRVATSGYTESEQGVFDDALYNNLGVISNNLLFEKLKDYEHRYGYTSEDFYTKWMHGEVPSSPDIQEWMIIYKNILKHNCACLAE